MNYDFQISDQFLRSICRIFQLPTNNLEGKLVFLGLRGVLPSGASNSSFDYSSFLNFERRHNLQVVQPNYYYPRCVLGQWLPTEGKVAVFPASTVPNLGYVSLRNKRKHQFNQLVPGIYNYRKGMHPFSSSSWQQHRAFRMQGKAIVRRANYEERDGRAYINYFANTSTIQVSTPADNIHAARNNPRRTIIQALRNQDYSYSFTMADCYSSFGCQVVVGNPEQYLPSGTRNGDWNAWDKFQENAYENHYTSQESYKYILIDGLFAHQLAHQNSTGNRAICLVFGSQGEHVRLVQTKLKELESATTGTPYYQGSLDGDYGPKMGAAVINFQKDFFDGTATSHVDERTARALGVSDWPRV